VCRTALFVTVQEHFIAYCRRREAVKLFRFLLPPYSLTRTRNNGENYNFHRLVGGTGFRVNLCIIYRVHGITKFLNAWAAPLNGRNTLSLAELAYHNSHISYPCLINSREF
jgi:hypothetical protein